MLAVIPAVSGATSQAVALMGMNDAQPGVIEVDQTSIDFGQAYNGYGVTKQLFVMAQGLTEDISLRVTGRDSIHFDHYPRTITPAQAAEGTYVPIRLFPYSKGYLQAELILSSPGVEDVHVVLHGIGIKTSAFIYVDQDTMAMISCPAVAVTKCLQVVYHRFNGWIASPRQAHVIDNVDFEPIDIWNFPPYSTSIDGDDCFTVIKSSIIATDGVTDTCVVKVCYNPMAVGSHHAQLKLWSNVAYPVIVQLEGLSEQSNGYIPEGDVNGDGLISVNDITFLIDGVLSRGSEGLNGIVDVDGDGEIGIGDITLLIDRVLSQ
jgi:hypothetical protein